MSHYVGLFWRLALSTTVAIPYLLFMLFLYYFLSWGVNKLVTKEKFSLRYNELDNEMKSFYVNRAEMTFDQAAVDRLMFYIEKGIW